MTKSALFNRIKTLIAVRAFFVTILLGTFFVFDIGYSIFPYPFSVLYIIIFLYSLTIIYSVLLGRANEITFAYVQLILDVLSAMALIFLTGGIESWFNSLPLIVTIAAAIVLNKKAGYVIAITSSIMYGSLIDLQYYRIIPVPYDPMLLEKDFLYNIFSHITALLLTAYLIGHLTFRLERKGIDFEDLSLFNKEVIENTPSGLFTTDNNGFIKIFNRAAEEITGVSRTSAIGQHVGNIFPFMKHPEKMDRAEEELNTEKDTKILGITMTRMRDAKSQEAGFICIFQDLTEIKHLGQEMKRRESLATIGEFSANIAHEIRNPLASLKSSIEMLKEDHLASVKRDRLMDIALNEMDRLNAIITDLLEYSKPSPGEIKEFDVHAALNKTVVLLKTGSAKGIKFRGDLSTPLFIKADEEKLQQVFWNMGINALDSMSDGGSLTISTLIANGLVNIAFEDTGRGIAPEDFERIFYPFFTTKKKGTGLGLSIANRIIEDHGGYIAVKSVPNKGARFDIFIPKPV
jgi:two-component system sensor histidine kinase PilS (NtrC family)